MSEAKHTPGPWEWSEDSPDAVLRGGDRDVVLRPNYGICVGDIYGIIMAKKEDKDLIAAAPDLLEALEDCCVIARPKNPSSCCPVYRPGEHGGCAENEDCECNIWKAIQKARGQG